MAEHTPTPWCLDGLYVTTREPPTVGPSIADCGKSPILGRGTQAANAALIIKAVNHHETLLDALRFALEVMESYAFSSGNDPRTATPESAIGRARAAIAAVVGGVGK